VRRQTREAHWRIVFRPPDHPTISSTASLRRRQLESAALRFDDIVESQIGDAVIHPDHVDLSVLGSKTDSTLVGQAAVLPGPGVPGSRAHVVLEGVRLGLRRLAALPPEILGPLATQFRISCTVREVGRGVEELSAWPDDIRALAAPLYKATPPGCRCTAFPSTGSGTTPASTRPRTCARKFLVEHSWRCPPTHLLQSGCRSTAWAATASAGGGP
jgi:hypothetical protein